MATISGVLSPESRPTSSLAGALGRWSHGGVLLIRVGQQPVPIDALKLPAALWSIMALLIKAAHRASIDGWPLAFSTSRELATKLKKNGGLGGGDPENVTRFIYRLRAVLSKSKARINHPSSRQLSPSAWSRQLLEYQQFGYRLSLPAENLSLTIFNDDSLLEKI